jgi:hypothetical protein
VIVIRNVKNKHYKYKEYTLESITGKMKFNLTYVICATKLSHFLCLSISKSHEFK